MSSWIFFLPSASVELSSDPLILDQESENYSPLVGSVLQPVLYGLRAQNDFYIF